MPWSESINIIFCALDFFTR